jgi:hypothetical protein
MRIARSLPLIAVLVVAPLAGCGGDGDAPATTPPPTPRQQVQTAAQRILSEHDAAVVCRRFVTTGFMQQVFKGDVQACTQSEIADAPKTGKQVVGDVRVTGAKASVEIVQRGGEHDGLAGHYTFAREGRSWKLDAFEDDVVRSTLVLSADQAGRDGGSGAFAYPPLRDCVTKQFESMPIEDAREFLFAGLREAPNAKKLGNRLLTKCPDELARYVAEELATGVAEGHSQAYVDCMRRQLTFLLMSTGLAKEALKGNTSGAGTAALKGLALGADRNCQKEKSGGSA